MTNDSDQLTPPADAVVEWNPWLSSTALVLSNLVPLAGALFLGWNVFSIIFIFWLENVVIGLFNVLRMATVSGQSTFDHVRKFFVIPFFVIHYGMFTLVHGIFVFALFCPEAMREDVAGQGTPGTFPFFWSVISQHLPSGAFMALACLLVSHGISFFANFIRGGERHQTNLDQLMMSPYGRIVLLHITIIASGFLVIGLGMGQLGIAVLVLLKIAMDLHAHRKERRRFRS